MVVERVSPTCRHTAHRLGALLVVVVVLGVHPELAHAQSSDERETSVEDLSREEKKNFLEFFRAGKKAYTSGKFERAVPFFEKAYEILPKPELKYRIGLSHERAGNAEKAIEFYRTFLREKPETDKRGQVESTIERLERQIRSRNRVQVHIETTPPGARVYVRKTDGSDDDPAPRGRTPMTLDLAAAPLEIALEKEGYETIRRQFDLEAGETYNFNYALPARNPGGGDSKTVALVATVVGGMGAVMGGTLYGVGIHCGRNRKNCSRSLFNTAVIGSYVGGGLGVTGLGTAAVLGLTGDSKRRSRRSTPRPTRPRLEFVVAPRFLGLRGRF